jgi:hypothetical protein
VGAYAAGKSEKRVLKGGLSNRRIPMKTLINLVAAVVVSSIVLSNTVIA